MTGLNQSTRRVHGFVKDPDEKDFGNLEKSLKFYVMSKSSLSALFIKKKQKR